MNRMHEAAKLDLGVVPQTLNNSNVTGRWFAMKDHRRALGVLQVGALAVTKTAKLEVFEAQDAAGTGAQLVDGAAATVAANADVAEATVVLTSVAGGEAITINGIAFTAHASTTTAANREFSISGNDTADAGELVAVINDPVYGVPGIVASNSGATVTLRASDPGAAAVTVSSAASTFTIATTLALAYVEIDGQALSDGFDHIACKITSTGNGGVAALLMRGDGRDAIAQHVGAAAVV